MVTRGEGDYEGKKGKGHQGTCIKDPWTKPKGRRIEGRRWGWVGQGVVVEGKWRQLYLNNNKKDVKISQFADNIILHIGNPKNPQKAKTESPNIRTNK